MNALTVIEPASGLPAVLGAELTMAHDFAQASKADATRKAYGLDFEIFSTWCRGRSLSPSPAEATTVAAFLAAEAARGRKPSTIGRRVATIRYIHKLAHQPTTSA